jgi:hypothetical protein
MKAKYAYRFGMKTGIFIVIFMTIMIFAPVIVRMCEKAGHERFAGITAYTGYTWMAVLFLFFSFSLCIDFCRLCVYVAERIFKTELLPALHVRKCFLWRL